MDALMEGGTGTNIPRRRFVWALGGCLALGILWWQFASAPGGAVQGPFVVPRDASYADTLEKLADQGVVRSVWVDRIFLSFRGAGGTVAPGGYELAPAMNAWSVARVLAAPPPLRWVVIPEGIRKEEIAELFKGALGWSDVAAEQWVTRDTAVTPDYLEGVYFPDTYLIPLAASGKEVTERLIAKFNETFAAYAPLAAEQNIKWTTVVKLASIVQREAAGKGDMPIIAGILWNRLERGMRLEVDATLQYARGDTGKGWWAPVNSADKKRSSPFNTYLVAGLPPHPIANPGRNAIAAVLAPAKTDCLFYLHGADREIHCAKNYEEHKRNIQKYL